MARVLLVDGVGNAVIVDRVREGAWFIGFQWARRLIGIQPTRKVFVKTSEQCDGLDVYRLKDKGSPPIRHINQHLIVEGQLIREWP